MDHVVAGYRFLMRYYNEGDKIYIFGFSRGAYTARFLAEMIYQIGLLSRGNEEMVRFAWNTFSDYQRTKGNNPQTKEDKAREEFMKKFRKTFCYVDKHESDKRTYTMVHFLGLFDCVNSVGTFEIPFHSQSYEVIASPPAKYIRHAISIHERRLKFKPALFHMDEKTMKELDCDVKEVWFAGNHGDVGGGWGLQPHQRQLLSDIPLQWMLQELDNLPDDPPQSKLTWKNSLIVNPSPLVEEKAGWLSGFFAKPEPSPYEARLQTCQPHDMLAFNRGASHFGTLAWWILEILPFFTRLELEGGKWVPRHFPPNLGAKRDIPLDANIHPSVKAMNFAGILSPDQMPVLGGDHPEEDPDKAKAFMSSWEKLRQRRADKKPDDQEVAKCWDEAGDIAARVWSLY